MQLNQSSLAQLFTGFKVLFNEGIQSADPQWSKFAMLSPSDKASELYHWLGAIPSMKELLGELTTENLAASTYQIFNKEFASLVGVKQADIERNSLGLYNTQFSAMGMAAAEHPDELTANLLINGFTQKDYTGKNFFDATKLQDSKDKTGFTNKGTKKLSADNFTTARANIRSRLNSAGRPMNLGRKLLLVVSPDNETLGRQILQADYIAQAATNKAGTENISVAGVTNVNKGTAELLVWTRLAANPNMWFLLDVGYPVKPLILQEEKKTSLLSLTSMESDHVFKTHEFLYQGYGRYNAGYGLPQLAYGSTGADAA